MWLDPKATLLILHWVSAGGSELQDLSGMHGAETEQDRPLLSLILSPGLFNATEAVTALLSSGNRWANGSCHPTLVCLRAAHNASAENSRLTDSGIYLKQYLLSRSSAL